MSSPNNLTTFFTQCQSRIETLLKQTLPPANNTLNSAIRYSTLNGGKRFRPVLSYAIADYCNAPFEHVDSTALAIELIHCYSLVHDDLPAMDDDDLRRGKATCHIEYDEATAILVGDALQPMAFKIIALTQIDAQTKVQLISQLAQASGAQGMVLGQSLDIEATATPQTLDALQNIHYYKTGQLISASILMAATALNCSLAERQLFENYGKHLGIMFQISDDILDVTSDTATLGKAQGSDERSDKSTYVSLLGLEQAKQALQSHHQQAMSALDKLPNDSTLLKQLGDFVVNRQN